MFDELIELFNLEEVPVKLRPQELQAAQVHLLLHLVPGESGHLPQMVSGLEQDVHEPFLSAVGHQLGFLEEVTRLDHFLLREVNLSQIEQGVARLNDKMVQASNALVLEALTGIVNAIAKFIERLPNAQLRAFSLQVLLRPEQQAYRHLQIQQVRNNRLLCEPLIQLSMAGKERFSQVVKELSHVIRILLLLCVKAFQTPQMAAQWRQLFGGFFGHVTKTIEDIQQRN